MTLELAGVEKSDAPRRILNSFFFLKPICLKLKLLQFCVNRIFCLCDDGLRLAGRSRKSRCVRISSSRGDNTSKQYEADNLPLTQPSRKKQPAGDDSRLWHPHQVHGQLTTSIGPTWWCSWMRTTILGPARVSPGRWRSHIVGRRPRPDWGVPYAPSSRRHSYYP